VTATVANGSSQRPFAGVEESKEFDPLQQQQPPVPAQQPHPPIQDDQVSVSSQVVKSRDHFVSFSEINPKGFERYLKTCFCLSLS